MQPSPQNNSPASVPLTKESASVQRRHHTAAGLLATLQMLQSDNEIGESGAVITNQFIDDVLFNIIGMLDAAGVKKARKKSEFFDLALKRLKQDQKVDRKILKAFEKLTPEQIAEAEAELTTDGGGDE